MSLKTRLIMLTSIWIVLLVALFNLFIYFFFVRMSTLSENRLVWNKAQIILRDPDIHSPKNWDDPKLLDEFLEPNTLIRIIDRDNTVRTVSFSDENLLQHPPVFRTDYYWVSKRYNGFRAIFIQVPIYSKKEQVGQLEIGKSLNVLNDYLSVLVTALTLTSIGILLFSVVGGFFYTRFIFRPIRELFSTMQTIQKKGSFAKLSPELTMKQDELGRLGMTFNEMIDRLEENDRRQRQFVGDASHELRTPLTVIESYVSLLSRWGGDDPSIREEALEAIKTETKRLKTLTSSLLRLAESEREAEPNRQETPLIPLIRQTIDSFKVTFHRNISLLCEGDDAAVYADPEQIRQLLVILLDNAIKYSSDDIELSLEDRPSYVLLKVKDRGIGIPEDELPHIFERFYRVDKARGRKTGGSGLGLSIAKRIVDLHHGSIDALSEEGVGTTIRVKLPKRSETFTRSKS
ncbi:ATP-binding protein [Paenibacillus hamazuiensis]|uniref:ATP-binding protein n=1 Tax=Paenibacillus hamazuiensis TaxID=2936508 RepID=UPI00200C9971|nr:ATP-binding protein [Paenibacillus hamazuiensis]